MFPWSVWAVRRKDDGAPKVPQAYYSYLHNYFSSIERYHYYTLRQHICDLQAMHVDMNAPRFSHHFHYKKRLFRLNLTGYSIGANSFLKPMFLSELLD